MIDAARGRLHFPTAVMTHFVSTLRIAPLPASAMYRFPDPSALIAVRLVNLA